MRARNKVDICGRIIKFFSSFFSFLGARPLGGALRWVGARASPRASPCRSAFGAPRGDVVWFSGRGGSSPAARARAFGLPSPLNVHRACGALPLAQGRGGQAGDGAARLSPACPCAALAVLGSLAASPLASLALVHEAPTEGVAPSASPLP